MSCQIEEKRYNETICLWITIYIYIYRNICKRLKEHGPQHMTVQKQDDQHEHTFSNYVRIQDVVQKTCQRQ